MSFVRYGLSALIAAALALFILAAPAPRAAHADGHEFGGIGLAFVFHRAALNDGLGYTIDGATVPREGEAYEGWLVNSATGERVSTGVMDVDEEGSIFHLYATPDGSSIFELGYDTVEITREPAPDDDPGPGETLYSYTQPEALLDEVRHLLSRGLPPERAGERGPGDPDRPGDLVVLFNEIGAALRLANAAMEAETLDAFRAIVRELLALDERLLLEEAAIHTELILGAHGLATDVTAGLLDGNIATAEGWTLRARAMARAALAADSLAAGRAALDGAADALTSARGAVAGAQEWAQGFAVFHVPAIPETPESEFGGVLPFAESNEAIRKEIATAANPFGGFGRILVRSVAASSDSLSYRLNGVAVPREGEAYEGWLVNSATGERVSTGVMEVRGSRIVHLYRSPGGENIIELGYDTVEITREPTPDDDPGPGELVYAYTQPEALLNEVQHLLSHGLPPERAGEPGPGDPGRPGDFEVLEAEFGEAIGLAEAALAAETLDAFRDAVRALIAVDEQLLLEEAGVHAELLAGVHGPRVDLEVTMMERHTSNAETRTLRVRGLAEAALAADSLEAGKAALGGAVSELRVGRASVAEAAGWAQSLMAFLAPSPPDGGDAAADGEDAAADGEDAAADGEDAAADGDGMAAPPPPSSGNAGLAAGGGAAGWRWAALIAAIGATAAAAACARRGAGRRRAVS